MVLVEGESDRRAVEAYARRLGRSLSDDGAMVVAMGGATSVAHAVDVYGPNGLDVRLAGLCDRNESGYVVRALRRIGIATTTSSLSEHGFFVCDADLEDELIRSLGTDEMVRFIERQGELRPFGRCSTSRRSRAIRSRRSYVGSSEPVAAARSATHRS